MTFDISCRDGTGLCSSCRQLHIREIKCREYANVSSLELRYSKHSLQLEEDWAGSFQIELQDLISAVAFYNMGILI